MLSSLSARLRPARDHMDVVMALPPLPRSWEELSEDTWTHILQFLTPADISRVRAVSTRLQTQASDNELWTCLMHRDFKVNNSGTGVLSSLRRFSGSLRGRDPHMERAQHTGHVPAFRKYAQMYADHHRRLAHVKEAVDRQQKIRNATVRSRYCRIALDVFQFLLGIGSIGVYGFVSMLLLLLKLQGHNLSWWAVFLPCLGTVFHPICCAGLGAVVEACGARATEMSTWYNLISGDTHNFVSYAASLKTYFCDLSRSKRCLRLTILFFFAACMIAAPITLALKLEGVVTASWGIIFIPIWLLLGCSCLWPYSGLLHKMEEDESDYHLLPMLLCVWVLPLIATLGVVTAILDGHNIHLIFAFIPLLLYASFFCCGACVLCIVAIKERGEDRRIAIAIAFSILVVLGLALVAEVIPSVQEWKEGTIPHLPIMIPVVIVAGVLMLACCCGGCFACKKSRGDRFQDLYTFRWTHARVRAAGSNLPSGAQTLPNPFHATV